MVKFLGALFLLGVLVFLGWGIYQLSVQRFALEKRAGELKAQVDALKDSAEKTRAEIDYFSNQENLEKEAKSQFNFRKPDEKLIIIVPGTSTNKSE